MLSFGRRFGIFGARQTRRYLSPAYTNGETPHVLIPNLMYPPQSYLKGAVFDLSGTVVDAGVKAPVKAFMGAFKDYKVPVTEQEARIPMGKPKKVHIRELGNIKRVNDEWKKVYGNDFSERDAEKIYSHFIEKQMGCLSKHSQFIPSALSTLNYLRSHFNLQLGATSGYTRNMIHQVGKEMAKSNFYFDISVGSDEVKNGRPYGDGCMKVQEFMEIKNAYEMVKVGDTTVDVEEGQNAKMWTIALIKWGNYVGMDENEMAMMESSNQLELFKIYEDAIKKFKNVNPDYIATTISYMPFIVEDINNRLANGEKPRSYDKNYVKKTLWFI